MWFIEPLKVEVEIAGEQLPVRGRRSRFSRLRINPIHAWLFEKLIREENGFEVIDEETINEILIRELDKKLEGVKNVVPEIADRLLRYPRYFYSDFPPLFIYRDILVILSPYEDGLIYVISKEKEKCNSLLERFERRIREISEIVMDFGINIKGLYYGESFVEHILKETAVTIEKGEFRRELEREVYESILENITTAVSHNLVLGFGRGKSKPFETFEYDILSCLDGDLRLQIEVKDYSMVKSEIREENGKLKGKLILEPLDKARLVGAKCIVVLDGFEENLFKEYEMFGSARGVIICNKENYLEPIRKLIIERLGRIVYRFYL